MTGKLTIALVLLVNIIAALSMTEAKPQIGSAVGAGFKGVTGIVRDNSCSEEFCYHNNHERRDRNAKKCGPNTRRWSYEHPTNGRCYCYEEC